MKTALGLLSPSGRRARLSVLIFHRVLPRPDPLFPDEVHADRFDQICRWLAQGFQVLPLGEAIDRLRDDRLPARAAAITFDDGYADNHDVALPILQRHGLNATFFVSTGFLDGGRMWNDTLIEALRLTSADRLDLAPAGIPDVAAVDLSTPLARRQAIGHVLGQAKYLAVAQRQQAVDAVARIAGAAMPGDLMMTSPQVQALHAAGMGVGGHTVTHPILRLLQPADALAEIRGGRERLQALLQAPVPLFAYPNGRPGEDFDDGTVDLVRQAGFEAAVTTAWGAARRGADPFRLPRFTPWDRTRLRFTARLAMNLARTPS